MDGDWTLMRELPPAPEVTMQTLQRLLDSVTITLVVHPDDEARIQDAIQGLADAPPMRVVASSVMPPGKMATWRGSLLPGDAAALEDVTD